MDQHMELMFESTEHLIRHPDTASLNMHYSHSHTLPRKLIRKTVQSNSLQRSQKRMWSAWKCISYSHLSNWGYFILKNKERKKTSSWRLQSKECHVQFTVWFVPISHSPFPSISFIYVTLIQVIHIKKMMEVGPEVFKMTFSIRQTGSNEEQASESGCYSVIWVTWPEH